MSRVLVVGDIVTDVLAVYSGHLATGSDTPARIYQTPGGSAANTAAWLARTGCRVTFAGAVGDDPPGAQRVAELEDAGVDTCVRVAVGTPTGSVVVLSDRHERTMLCDRGANALLSTVDIDRALADAAGAGHLHLSGYVLFDGDSAAAGRHALAAAAARGMTTSVDAASAGPLRRLGGALFLDWVQGTDLLLANLDEARALLGTDEPPEVLAGRLATGVRYAVVKLGADGAVWAGPERQTVRVPAQPAVLADPTGAGDAFAAGLLASWLSGADPVQALRTGALLGAEAVARTGARPG